MRAPNAAPRTPAIGIGPALDVVALALALVAVAAATAARRRGLDVDLFLTVNGWRGIPDGIWHVLNVAGLGVTALAVLTLAPRSRPALVAALLWLLVVGGGITQAVKRAVPSPRPAAVLDAGSVHLIGETLRLGSMPSGHAMTASAVLFILVLAGGPFWRRPLAAACAAALAAAIAVSRIAAGSHWPADVAAGAVLGWAVACVSIHLARATRTEAFLAAPAGQWVLGAAQIGCGAVIAAPDGGVAATLPVQWALGALAFGAGVRTLTGRCAPAVAACARIGARP